MRDAVEMWRHTRMVVLTALCAALYAALLIPFKAIVLIPGLTEVRPAAALPVVLALLFGPAAAWGAAFGNLIGDFFGTLTPGSFFGLIGNFLFAYVPWRLWVTLSRRPAGPPAGTSAPEDRRTYAEATGSLRQLPLFIFVSIVAACACAVVIAWGVDLLGMAPYHVLGVIISLNNTLPTVVIGAALLPLLYHRSRRWGLLASQNMSDADLAPGPLAPLGVLFVIAGSLAGVGIAVLIFRLGPEGQPPAWLLTFGSVRNAAGVCVALIVIGSALLARPPRLRARRGEAPASPTFPPSTTGDAGASPLRGLAFDRLSFRYPSWGTLALDDVSLAVQPGQWLTLVGPTGAGKSTLCLCAGGVIPQLQDGEFSGAARVFDLDTRQAAVHDISMRLGTLLQHFESQLFCTDVQSEIAFALEQRGLPRDEMRRRVDEAIAAMELGHLQRSDPATLSGGEKQRLALAALLAADPDVLVLDEPTTDVDPQGRQQLMATLAALRERGKAIVIVENDLWPPRADDTIAALAEGRLQVHGPAAELLRDPERCRELGLRPLALPDLFARLGRAERPLTVAEAVGAWQRPRGAGVPPALPGMVGETPAPRDVVGEPIITVAGLRHSYDRYEALAGVDLQVRRGEFVALLGSNGAGKTTLARHLNGLLKPTAGRVLIAGQDTAQASPARLSRTVGYLFQDPDDEIFCQRVDEEVAFGLRNMGLPEAEIRKRTGEALEWMGLTHAAEADPFTLTRGERQQVALASVLAIRPEVIVFDEPTTGLDGVEQVRMMERLRQLNAQGHTIIMITHATWAAAAHAHRVVLMAHGAIIADGPTRAIFADDELLQQADQVAPDIVAFSRQACGQVFLSVEEAVESLRT
jgi:energy-coupling factor transport system ATP-binding protein